MSRSPLYGLTLRTARLELRLATTETHRDTISPRGTPAEHVHLRLDRCDFAGAKVHIGGLEACLPLFGTA